MLNDLIASIRFASASIFLLSGGYTAIVLGGSAIIAPHARLGSLIEVDGRVVGSALIAQNFERPEYLWPRPSAVGYAANAAGGSNLSPANPAIAERAAAILDRLGATPDNPAPADLVLASGAGLDPHITLDAALYQAPRIATARGVPPDRVKTAIRNAAGPSALVNVLLTNIALDEAFPTPPAGHNP